jgi:hypothetical protein
VQTTPPNTDEQAVEICKLLLLFRDQLPPSFWHQVSAVQTIAQLLNPKTIVRNLIGNTGFMLPEFLSDSLAAMLDVPISVITGQRSRALPNPGVTMKSFMQGTKKGIIEAAQGIDTSGFEGKYDTSINAMKFGQQGTRFKSGIPMLAEKLLSITNRAIDRGAYTAGRDTSLDIQMRAAGVTTPTPQMIATAHEDGLYRSYQDNNALSDLTTGLKKLLNFGKPFGLGDLILKYPTIPANLLARALDYSPAGIVKTIYDLVRPIAGEEPGKQRQKKFTENIARVLVGSGIIALGMLLAKLGIVTGEAEKDKDIREADRDQGGGPFKINVDALIRYFDSGMDPNAAAVKEGDQLVSYDWFQPNSLLFTIGSSMAEPTTGIGAFSQFAEQMDAGIESLTGQSFLYGWEKFVTTAFDQNRGGFSQAIQNTLASMPASFVPTLFNQIAQVSDNTLRSTYDPNPAQQALNEVLKRLPGLRTTLEPVISTLGKDKEQYQEGSNNILNIFFNPAFITRYREDPILSEVIDIYRETGDVMQAPKVVPKSITVNGVKKTLSAEEMVTYQRYIGGKTQDIMTRLLSSKTFQSLPAEEKASQMADIISDVDQLAKMELFGHKPTNLRTLQGRFQNYQDSTRIDTAIKIDLAKAGYSDTSDQVKELMTQGKFKEAATMLRDWNIQGAQYVKEVVPTLLQYDAEEAKSLYNSITFSKSDWQSLAKSVVQEKATATTMKSMFQGAQSTSTPTVSPVVTTQDLNMKGKTAQQRATYIKQRIQGMSSSDRLTYLKAMQSNKILSDAVLTMVNQ